MRQIPTPIGIVIIGINPHAGLSSNWAIKNGIIKPMNAPIKIEIIIMKTDIKKFIQQSLFF
jgi:hypothetical protein